MQELNFNKEIGDMEGAEARATLQDVRSKYSEAREEYEEAQEDLEEYKDNLEASEQEAKEAREFFASFAADASGLSEDTILDKFDSAEEIREEFLGDDVEFQLLTEDEEDDENKFSEKEQKSDDLPGEDESSEFSERASQVISSMTVQHE